MVGLGILELLILLVLAVALIGLFIVRRNRAPTEKPPDDDAGW